MSCNYRATLILIADTPEPPSKPRSLDDLSEDELKGVIHHFRTAALCRARQWDAENAIERVLGRELDFVIEDWAFDVEDDASTSSDIIRNEQEILDYLEMIIRK